MMSAANIKKKKPFENHASAKLEMNSREERKSQVEKNLNDLDVFVTPNNPKEDMDIEQSDDEEFQSESLSSHEDNEEDVKDHSEANVQFDQKKTNAKIHQRIMAREKKGVGFNNKMFMTIDLYKP